VEYLHAVRLWRCDPRVLTTDAVVDAVHHITHVNWALHLVHTTHDIHYVSNRICVNNNNLFMEKQKNPGFVNNVEV